MTDVITLSERVARIEEKLGYLAIQEDRRVDREEVMDAKLDTLLAEHQKTKGFIGGILFVGASLWAFLKMGLPHLLKLMGKDI